MLTKKRLLIGCGILAAGLCCAAWIGVYTPPVVRPVHDPEWVLGGSQYPVESKIVSTTAPDGRVLRGLFAPADPGAPLVVHFAGAGAAVTASPIRRFEFRELAIAGFASLALDYRGVGLSDGPVDSAALAVDALAIYDEALRRVGGDPRRLILRGTSLGTVAIAAVLGSGRTADSLVLFAPVLAETVAVRYGYATQSSVLVSLIRPFLRGLPAPPLPSVLGKHSGGLFVCADARDELVSPSEYRNIAAAVRARSGTLVELTGKTDGDRLLEDLVVPLRHHVRIGIEGAGVGTAEREFLSRRFSSQPPVAQRAEAVLAAGDPALADAVRSDPAALDRLRTLVGQVLGPEPDSLLAVAAGLPKASLANLMLLSRPNGPKSWLDAWSSTQLTQLMDRSDPAGEMPSLALVAAALVVNRLRDEGARIGRVRSAWPVQRVLRLARAILREPDGEFVFESSTDTRLDTERRFFLSKQDPDRVAVRWREGSVTEAREVLLTPIRMALPMLPKPERRRLLVRLLCKVVGVDERMVEETTGVPSRTELEVRTATGWRRVDCDRLALR